MTGFETIQARAISLVEKTLDELLSLPDGPEARVVEAMRYAALGGGKRFRPFLSVAVADLLGAPLEAVGRAAAAIECVHCYSLIHDDLPVMDDDDMRRGKPSLHRAFDEATAILAGDALLTLAFEVLTDAATHENADIRLELISGLARAAGMQGMVGGQTIDMLSPDMQLDAGGLTRLQKMKTGALIGFAVDAGALMGRARAEQRHALANYAHDIGLAFQIADDVLDVTGGDEIGKSPGKDMRQNKVTFATLLGVERAEEQARQLVTQAINHLDIFGPDADPLRQAAEFVISRKA
jgi:farnesyl diphosphate synthase